MRVFPISNYNQTRSFNFGIAQELGIPAALLFNEIDFWSSKSKDGWVYKTLADLCEQTLSSQSTVQRTISVLVKSNWLEKKVKKVNGAPTLHFRVAKRLHPMNIGLLQGIGTQTSSVDVVSQTSSKDLFKMNTSSKNSSTNSNTKATPLEDTLKEFREHRKEIRKSITDGGYKKLLVRLEQLAPGDDAAKIAILDQSIMSGWSGVFPPKADNQTEFKRKGMVY